MTRGGSWRMSPDSRRRDPLPRGWKNIRAGVLARDGWQCTVVEQGQRCPVRVGLEVDHLGARDNHDPTNLATKCKAHHASKTAGEANAARWAKRPQAVAKPHPGVRS